MRTLILLSALLLLALQAEARALQETADQVPTQDQPEAKDQGDLWAEDQDQAGDSEQDVAISFTGEERLTRAADLRNTTICTCRSNFFCKLLERKSGSCKLFGHKYRLCCK